MTQNQSHLLSDNELDQVVERLLALTHTKKIFTFTGTLGAGKTTLIPPLCKTLGVTEPVQSPTYTYMNIYKTPETTIYHFDLYRLSSYHDFVEAGFEEYLSIPNSFCFIEWPEVVQSTLPVNDTCSIFIDYHEKKRLYTLSYS